MASHLQYVKNKVDTKCALCSDLRKLNHVVSLSLWCHVRKRAKPRPFIHQSVQSGWLWEWKKRTGKRKNDPISSLQEHDRGIKAILKFNGACKFLFLPQFVTSWEVHPIGALRCLDECLRGSVRRTDTILQHGSAGRHVPCRLIVRPCYQMEDATRSFQD